MYVAVHLDNNDDGDYACNENNELAYWLSYAEVVEFFDIFIDEYEASLDSYTEGKIKTCMDLLRKKQSEKEAGQDDDDDEEPSEDDSTGGDEDDESIESWEKRR